MSNRRVFSLPIIIRFNVFKDADFGLASRHVPLPVNQFDFQGMKEALRDGVIVAGGFAPHAPVQAMALDQLLIPLRTILAATISVEDRALGEAATEQGHAECVTHQLLRHPSVHRPPHNGSGVQVHHDGEIQPPLVSPDRGDITGPFLIGRRRVKVLFKPVGCDGFEMGRVSRDCIFLRLNRVQSQDAHPSGNAVLAARAALIV